MSKICVSESPPLVTEVDLGLPTGCQLGLLLCFKQLLFLLPQLAILLKITVPSNMVKGISGNFFNIIIRCEGTKKGYGMAKIF
jgi:hypothetical protein